MYRALHPTCFDGFQREGVIRRWGPKPLQTEVIIPAPRKRTSMSRRLLVVVFTASLVASVFFAFTPVQAHAVSLSGTSPTAVTTAVAPAASITYTLLNGYGYSTSDFYPGEVGWGSFYFIVTDPLDRSVNITITDPNAARDGVSTPAFHYEATLNSTTSTFDSYTAHVGYNFPAGLAYGGSWAVNFSAPSGGSVQQNVTLFLYYTAFSSSVGSKATLPGEALTLFWSLYLDSNGGGFYTHATNVWITGTYTGNGTVQNVFSQGRVALIPTNTGRGSWSGTVPLNSTPDSQLHFQVYAVTNVSGQIVENESSSTSVDVGVLSIQNYGIIPTPPSCSLAKDFFFTSGEMIAPCFLVGANFLGSFTPIPGLPVTFAYWNGTTHVTPSGAPTSLTTDSNGEASFTFLASVPPFSLESTAAHYDAVNFTVNVPQASALYAWTDWLNVSWTLQNGNSASGVVQVSLDHTEYYQGAIATTTWSISSTNSSLTGPVKVNGWEVTGSSGVLYLQGIINSSAQSGSFTFSVSAAMVGDTIYASVLASNATRSFQGEAYASVLTPSILLTPSSTYYNAGSTATVGATLNGGGSAASVQFDVWGYWTSGSALVTSGTIANGGTISVPIASNAPPQSVAVYAWASVGGQVIATNTVDLSLEQGYSILLGVKTASSYSDGSYQPGQSITLSYEVVSVGGAALPQVVTFSLFVLGYPNAYVIPNAGLSGTIPFTIPSNAPGGSLVLELSAQGALSAGPCFPTGGCIGVATIPINPNPSVLALEIGAGSGLTVGWLILLVLVIVVGAVLFFLMRRGGRFPPSKPTMTPPAPAPSTEPVSEWTPPETPPPPPPAHEPVADSSPPGLPEPPAPR